MASALIPHTSLGTDSGPDDVSSRPTRTPKGAAKKLPLYRYQKPETRNSERQLPRAPNAPVGFNRLPSLRRGFQSPAAPTDRHSTSTTNLTVGRVKASTELRHYGSEHDPARFSGLQVSARSFNPGRSRHERSHRTDILCNRGQMPSAPTQAPRLALHPPQDPADLVRGEGPHRFRPHRA